jgi:hypothetical protein
MASCQGCLQHQRLSEPRGLGGTILYNLLSALQRQRSRCRGEKPFAFGGLQGAAIQTASQRPPAWSRDGQAWSSACNRGVGSAPARRRKPRAHATKPAEAGSARSRCRGAPVVRRPHGAAANQPTYPRPVVACRVIAATGAPGLGAARRTADATSFCKRGVGSAPARRLKPRAHATKPAEAGSPMMGFLRLSHGRALLSPPLWAHARAVPTCSIPRAGRIILFSAHSWYTGKS